MFRGFLFGRAVRVVTGAYVVGLGRSDVELGIGGWVCDVVTSRCLDFFGGLFVWARGGSWGWVWVWLWVCGLLRVIIIGEGEYCFGWDWRLVLCACFNEREGLGGYAGRY